MTLTRMLTKTSPSKAGFFYARLFCCRDLAPLVGAFLFEGGAMIMLRKLSLLLVLGVGAALSLAASAIQPPTAPAQKCDQILLTWSTVTTRSNGLALLPGELARYVLFLSTEAAPIYVPAPNTSFTYSVPPGYTITSEDFVAVAAIDSAGLTGLVSPVVSLPEGSKCPKPPLAVPTNIRAVVKPTSGA